MLPDLSALPLSNSDRLIASGVSSLCGRPVLQIAGGWRHTMALDQEGNVWAWGWNKFGQLGERGCFAFGAQ